MSSRSLARKLAKADRGATAVEYALIAGLMAICVIAFTGVTTGWFTVITGVLAAIFVATP